VGAKQEKMRKTANYFFVKAFFNSEFYDSRFNREERDRFSSEKVLLNVTEYLESKFLYISSEALMCLLVKKAGYSIEGFSTAIWA
jgi:hypothetical protein